MRKRSTLLSLSLAMAMLAAQQGALLATGILGVACAGGDAGGVEDEGGAGVGGGGGQTTGAGGTSGSAGKGAAAAAGSSTGTGGAGGFPGGGAGGSTGGGAGGSTGGGAGTGGSAGKAGTGGAAGKGGSGGSAGKGGSGGSAGKGGSGGSAGKGGTAGSAGNSGSGGTAGNSGSAGIGGSGGGSGGGQCPPPDDNGPLKGLPYPAVDARGIKGIAYAPGDASTRIPLIQGAGTKVAGYNLPWIVVEPSKKNAPCSGGEVTYDGRCYKDVVGNQIKQLNDAGIRVTAILYGVPEWAHVGNAQCSPLNDTFKMFCAPDNPDDFARFAGMLAQRYDGQGGRGRIHNFVIHNEVNSNIWFDIGCGNGTACNVDSWVSKYAANYNQAYDRIKSHQSEAKVLVSLEQNFGEGAQNLNTQYPLIAGANFLLKLAPLLGNRNWQVAFHPYPKNLLKPEFSPLDWPNVTYGNAGQIVGWLRQKFPNSPHAWKVQFTESGINSSSPNSSEAIQAKVVCDASYNVFGTPWVTDYIYHGMYDDGLAAELQVGLFRADNSAKPAWPVWANQNDCGYQYAPYTRVTRSFGAAHWASSRLPPAGYKVEKSWYLDRNGDCNTQVVLWECNVGNHTTYLSKDPACTGAMNMGPVGYADIAQKSGQVPLYQCKVNNDDWFVSDAADCEGQSVVDLLGYVRVNPTP